MFYLINRAHQYGNKVHWEKLAEGVASWNEWRSENPDLELDFSESSLFLEITNRRMQFVLFFFASIISLTTNLLVVEFFLDPIRNLPDQIKDQILLYIPSFLSFSSASAILYIAIRLILFVAVATLAKQVLFSLLILAPGRIDLSGINLRNVNLQNSDLRRISLNFADLSLANLSYANLGFAEVIGANFSQTILTGACIQNWNISSETRLSGVQCEYIYLVYEPLKDGLYKFNKRLPKDPCSTFKIGEFEVLVRQQQETIDLIFLEGIDWKALLQTVNELRHKYPDAAISVQSIEDKGKGTAVVRLGTNADIETQSIIETSVKEIYDRWRRLEGEVKIYKETINILERTIKTMAENQTYQLTVNAQNVGAVSNGGTIHNVTQNANANLSELTKLIQALRNQAQVFPLDEKADVEIALEDLESDLADESKHDSKRLARRIFTIWGIACAIATGVAGMTDFSNNLLSLADYLNIEIPHEMILKNPHIPTILSK